MAIYNPRQVNEVAVFLVIGGEHQNVFYDAGWSKQQLRETLDGMLRLPIREICAGRSGLGGLTEDERADPDRMVPKFRTGGFNIIRAGGSAGKYSAIISAIGSMGLKPVIKEIET